MERIINAAPMAIDEGIQDMSKRRVPREPDQVPQHLPKFYVFAERGTADENLAVGAERTTMYGDATFDPYSRYFKHQTAFANLANENANIAMIKRLIPDDIGPRANIALYLDVLPTEVDRYERNSDGSIKVDNLGSPIIVGQTPGYKVKWVAEHLTTHAAVDALGDLTQKPGDQTDPVTGVQSVRYPILAMSVADLGSYGNRLGLRMWAPTTRTVDQMPTKLMASAKAYPYMFQCVYREESNTTPLVQKTLFGEQATMVTLKKTARDPLTNLDSAICKRVIEGWSNTTDARYDLVSGHFGRIVLFEGSLNELLPKFHAAEAQFADQFYDFARQVGPDIDPTDAGLFNIVSGLTSAGVPYQSFVFVDAPDAIKLTSEIPVWAAGGNDGDLSDAMYNRLVKRELERYADKEDELMDVAYHVESVFYDSGFPLDVKEAFAKVISRRHDTYVHLGTHVYGDRKLTASEEHSMAVYLRSKVRMFPESEQFATPAARCSIWGRSGLVRNSLVTERLPLTYEILDKSSKYWGAANGRWKEGESFTGSPGSLLTQMHDVNIVWVSNSVRNRNWDVGLNFVLRYDRSSLFFPAFRTVYDDDTSVLTSYPNVFALCTVNKVQHAAWREFTGTDDKTPAQLSDDVNDFVTARLANRFDNRYVFVPNAHFTSLDELRGFSWTLEVEAYMNNARTVQTQYTTAYRRSDLKEG